MDHKEDSEGKLYQTPKRKVGDGPPIVHRDSVYPRNEISGLCEIKSKL